MNLNDFIQSANSTSVTAAIRALNRGSSVSIAQLASATTQDLSTAAHLLNIPSSTLHKLDMNKAEDVATLRNVVSERLTLSKMAEEFTGGDIIGSHLLEWDLNQRLKGGGYAWSAETRHGAGLMGVSAISDSPNLGSTTRVSQAVGKTPIDKILEFMDADSAAKAGWINAGNISDTRFQSLTKDISVVGAGLTQKQAMSPLNPFISPVGAAPREDTGWLNVTGISRARLEELKGLGVTDVGISASGPMELRPFVRTFMKDGEKVHSLSVDVIRTNLVDDVITAGAEGIDELTSFDVLSEVFIPKKMWIFDIETRRQTALHRYLRVSEENWQEAFDIEFDKLANASAGTAQEAYIAGNSVDTTRLPLVHQVAFGSADGSNLMVSEFDRLDKSRLDEFLIRKLVKAQKDFELDRSTPIAGRNIKKFDVPVARNWAYLKGKQADLTLRNIMMSNELNAVDAADLDTALSGNPDLLAKIRGLEARKDEFLSFSGIRTIDEAGAHKWRSYTEGVEPVAERIIRTSVDLDQLQWTVATVDRDGSRLMGQLTDSEKAVMNAYPDKVYAKGIIARMRADDISKGSSRNWQSKLAMMGTKERRTHILNSDSAEAKITAAFQDAPDSAMIAMKRWLQIDDRVSDIDPQQAKTAALDWIKAGETNDEQSKRIFSLFETIESEELYGRWQKGLFSGDVRRIMFKEELGDLVYQGHEAGADVRLEVRLTEVLEEVFRDRKESLFGRINIGQVAADDVIDVLAQLREQDAWMEVEGGFTKPITTRLGTRSVYIPIDGLEGLLGGVEEFITHIENIDDTYGRAAAEAANVSGKKAPIPTSVYDTIAQEINKSGEWLEKAANKRKKTLYWAAGAAAGVTALGAAVGSIKERQSAWDTMAEGNTMTQTEYYRQQEAEKRQKEVMGYLPMESSYRRNYSYNMRNSKHDHLF